MSALLNPGVIIALVVQSVLIGSAGVAAGRVLRGRFPRLSTVLLRATGLSLFVLPVSTLVFQAAEIDVLSLLPPMAAVSTGGKGLPDTAAPAVAIASLEAGRELGYLQGHASVPAGWRPTLGDKVAGWAHAVAQAPSGLWLGAGFIYGVVMLFLASRMLKAHAELRCVRRLARAAAPSLQAECARVARSFGVPAPRLLLSEAVVSPAVAGVLPACVLLPADMNALGRGALEHVLGHELSHIARRDFFWHLLAKWAAVFYWFLPMTWALVRDMERLNEEAADDAVISSGGDRIAYARELLALANRMRTAGLQFESGPAMAQQPKALRRRIERILDASRRPGKCGYSRFGILVPLAATFAGCLTGFFIAAPAAALSEATPGASAGDSGPITLGFHIGYAEEASPFRSIETPGVMQRLMVVVSPRRVLGNLPDYSDDVLSLVNRKEMLARCKAEEAAGMASFQALYEGSQERLDAYKVLEEEVDEYKIALDEKFRSIEALMKELKKLPATSQADKERLRATIDAENKEHRALIASAQGEIDAREQKIMEHVDSEIEAAAKQVCEHLGLAFLFSDQQGRGLWWYDPRLDITQAFLAQSKAVVPLCEDSAGRMLKIGVLDTSKTAYNDAEALDAAVRQFAAQEGFHLILNGGERSKENVCLYASPELSTQ